MVSRREIIDMALIKCPECGKEFSDKAACCPNCGCPIDVVKKEIEEAGSSATNSSADSASSSSESTHSPEAIVSPSEHKNNTINKKIFALIPIFAVVVLVISIVSSKGSAKKKAYSQALEAFENDDYEKAKTDFDQLKGYKDADKYLSFSNAQLLMDEGKYEKAYKELAEINDFSGVSDALEETFLESISCVCLSDYRQYLKNPDSLNVSSIDYYGSQEEYPSMVMAISGENGWGGTSSSFVLYTWDTDEKKYEIFGTCDSLDEDDYDEDDSDDFVELLTCRIINAMEESSTKTPNADKVVKMKRIQKFIKDDTISDIEIIDGLNLKTLGITKDSETEKESEI